MVQVIPIPGGVAVYSPEYGVATFKGPDARQQAEQLALAWMNRREQQQAAGAAEGSAAIVQGDENSTTGKASPSRSPSGDVSAESV